eukprot:46925-Chlamydomonas_euryale.AAC.2
MPKSRCHSRKYPMLAVTPGERPKLAVEPGPLEACCLFQTPPHSMLSFQRTLKACCRSRKSSRPPLVAVPDPGEKTLGHSCGEE